MRAFGPAAFLVLAALAAPGAEPEPAPPYPFWDGQESIEGYARRANLEPTEALDLGNGVRLELVLIPAGKFTMGTSMPVRPARMVQEGQTLLAIGILAVLILVTLVIPIPRRRGWRLQFSLRWLVAFVFSAGTAIQGGVWWWETSEEWREYYRAWERYRTSEHCEKPAHEVTIASPFYMGKYEVTQEEYQQVTGANPSNFTGRDLPVERVSWHEAQEFCRNAGELRGQTVRLPREAEWEFACRAGTRSRYHTGDSEADLERAGWYALNSTRTTRPVGQKAANAWGLYDMHGNVWEWCQDWFEDYEVGAVTDPHGPESGDRRLLRGGAWDCYAR
jgi:formylglycine-generating enzyme required for sulfatase activity